MTELSKCAKEVVELTNHIEEVESQLKALKARRKDLTDKVMLDLMLESGTSRMVQNNIQFDVKLFVSGGWPKDPVDAQLAIDYLVSIGESDLIKSNVSADFPRLQFDTAEFVASRIEARYKDAKVQCTHKVHPMTLKKFVRERIEDGESVDLNVLKIYTGQTVKIRKLNR